MATVLVVGYSPFGEAKAKAPKGKAAVAAKRSAPKSQAKKKVSKKNHATKKVVSKTKALAKKTAKSSGMAMASRALSSAPRGPQQPLEVKGQARQLSMMLVLKNEKDQINFVQLRTDYKNEIPTTEF